MYGPENQFITSTSVKFPSWNRFPRDRSIADGLVVVTVFL